MEPPIDTILEELRQDASYWCSEMPAEDFIVYVQATEPHLLERYSIDEHANVNPKEARD